MTELKNRKNQKKNTSSEQHEEKKEVVEKEVKKEEKVVSAKNQNQNQKCESGCCLSSILMGLVIVAMGVLAYYQCIQIKSAETLLSDLKNDRQNMCSNFENKTKAVKQHFPQSDLLRYFAVTFEGRLSYESEELEKFVDSKDITQEERYINEYDEMKRREALYGPYIENGFEHDDRFYIKLSSPAVGYGLFAKTDIPAGSVIGTYGGRLTRVRPYGATDTDYAWSYQTYEDPETGENFEICIDGRIYGTWLRFVNHKHDSEANLYGMYVPYKNRWYLMYFSRSFIAKDEELFTSYGDFYWEARKDSHHLEAEPEDKY